MKDGSRIICRTWERCQILLYTGFASNRSSCHATNVTASTGTVNGSCDTTDRDNDEDEMDLAKKTTSPCCENIITLSAEVKVFPANPRGPSCVTEVSAIFDSVGEKEICFHSASFEYQKLCYTFIVYTNDKQGPCSSSPCQNNGHCFRTDQDNYKCVCQDSYVGDYCQTGPCQSADNHCQNDAYCQVHDGVTTCICKAGFFGPECSKGPSSLQSSFLKFTDTAEPTSFFCVINQICSFSLVLTSRTKMMYVRLFLYFACQHLNKIKLDLYNYIPVKYY
ncbi:delta and Notch-like epidermal growth factor-related receptor [Ruditapes philippinarum]|uniref:delta and Notch-like epidermal growth factor-related receptor n=1 Tax=Ruditapes philippinarum TaxID=129788 RepID=UPI00295B4DA3|nr:delta and Notch-like epidermal growth factor-related receptor [Ruditapes philippinarum]